MKLLQESKTQELLELKSQLEEKVATVTSLTKQISNFRHQLEDEDDEEVGSLTEALARMKLRQKEESERVWREKEELLGTAAQFKSELASCKVELAGTNASLMQARQECNQLHSAISSEVATHSKVANSLSELQLEHSETVGHLTEVEAQLREKSEEVEQIQMRLEETQEHCSTLQEELRLQNEVSAASARSMEVKMKERIRHLQSKMDNLIQKLSQVRSKCLNSSLCMSSWLFLYSTRLR